MNSISRLVRHAAHYYCTSRRRLALVNTLFRRRPVRVHTRIIRRVGCCVIDYPERVIQVNIYSVTRVYRNIDCACLSKYNYEVNLYSNNAQRYYK